MKVLIWGTGSGAKNLLSACLERNVEVLAYVDNNRAKQGQTHEGKPVIGPENLGDFAFDRILIASAYHDAIREQLLSLEYGEDVILDFHGNKNETLKALGRPECFLIEDFTFGEVVFVDTFKKYPFRFQVEDVAPPVPLAEQFPLVERLVTMFNECKRSQADLPVEYRPGIWEGNFACTCNELRRLTAERDIEAVAAILNNFCRHEISSFCLGGRAAYDGFCASKDIHGLLHNFKVWKYSTEYKADPMEVTMPNIGNPYGLLVDGKILMHCSLPNHFRAWRLNTLLEDVERPVVAEIGGGIGSLAYFLLKMLDDATYINFDLPETLLISSYFLAMAFPEKRVLLFDNPSLALDQGVLNQYDIILMPNFMLPNLADNSADAFVNTISMCEMLQPTVREYLSQIDRCGKMFFYNENIAHVPIDYNGNPAFAFPGLETFRLLSSGISRWDFHDAYSPQHTFREDLWVKKNRLLTARTAC